MYTNLVHSAIKLAVFPGDILYSDDIVAKAVLGFMCTPNSNTIICIIGSFEISEQSRSMSFIANDYFTVQETIDALKQLENGNSRKMLSAEGAAVLYEQSKIFIQKMDDPKLLEIFQPAKPSGMSSTVPSKSTPSDVSQTVPSK